VEPPTVHDSSDPELKMGGLDMSPGASNSSRNLKGVVELPTGDPSPALAGYQVMRDQIQSGLGVDKNRAGAGDNVERTAFEVDKVAQFGEIRTIDFVEKHESFGLSPFLYMQHAINRDTLKKYDFYNDYEGAADFMTAAKTDLPESVIFKVVGSKDLLGEERRQQGLLQVTQFWLQANPDLLKQQELAKEMYADVGVKDSERFLNISEEDQILIKRFEDKMQQLQAEAQQTVDELTKELSDLDLKDQKNELQIEKLQTNIAALNDLMKVQKAQSNLKLVEKQTKETA
jgi:hypothetical protein